MKSLKKWVNPKLTLQIALLLTGIVCLWAGIQRQEVRIVMRKAIYICLECIGIG